MSVDNILPQIIWNKYFLYSQYYGAKDLVLFQANLSTMFLEFNGKSSNGKQIRRLRKFLFFVTDYIKASNPRVEHKLTEIIMDFFFKMRRSENSERKSFMSNGVIDPTQLA